jgi:hypothetical protein
LNISERREYFKTNLMQTKLFTAKDFRDEGIQRAIDNANRKEPKWADMAYGFLLGFIMKHKEFMTEEIRESAEKLIPHPPSKRAWGGVIVRAVKAGLIYRSGYRNTKNIKAHCTPAAVWRSKI